MDLAPNRTLFPPENEQSILFGKSRPNRFFSVQTLLQKRFNIHGCTRKFTIYLKRNFPVVLSYNKSSYLRIDGIQNLSNNRLCTVTYLLDQHQIISPQNLQGKIILLSVTEWRLFL